MSDTRVVILDNYDSFAFNLYQAVGELIGTAPIVLRNDEIPFAEVAELNPTHVIVSPGPGDPRRPEYFGVCREAIAELGTRVPVLGVCLGHQGIATAFGGEVVRSPAPTHGKTSLIVHDGEGVFAGIASPLEAMRYHSLAVCRERLPQELTVTAMTSDGVVMGLRHLVHPIHGVQFHPESIGTPAGARIIANFLAMEAVAGTGADASTARRMGCLMSG
jgi:anthranilate synthase/aminodeoxychorismate synthase-like glutamine amidotransferase